MSDTMTFKLYTCGYVVFPANEDAPWENPSVEWSDLNSFTQGYVEAMLTDSRTVVLLQRQGWDWDTPIAFRHLAPETLARIMEDCARALDFYGQGLRPEWSASDGTGRAFWEGRQASRGDYQRDGFPPLTLYLGDDGKVYLREITQ